MWGPWDVVTSGYKGVLPRLPLHWEYMPIPVEPVWERVRVLSDPVWVHLLRKRALNDGDGLCPYGHPVSVA